MVKLKGPGLATRAAGGLGKTLIFAESKGRPYLKKWHKPKNPKTATQVSLRAMLGFLSANWATVPTPRQQTWEAIAAAAKVSPFNAYQSANLRNWHHFLAPSDGTPAARAHDWGDYSAASATAVSRGVLLSVTLITPLKNWGTMYFNVPGVGAPTAWDNLVGMTYAPTIGIYKFLHHPLPPGTYHYRMRSFADDGYMRPQTANTYTAVVL